MAEDGAGEDHTPTTLLSIEGLSVALPDGRPLLAQLSLQVAAGEIVALLGGSGAGKSTLVRALFEPDTLRAQGFSVEFGALQRTGSLGLVPQRGALFDHLDVAGNLRLARRQAARDGLLGPEDDGADEDQAVQRWLDAVDLPAELAAAGVAVGRLSGGQAQRVSVARTLAGGRRVLVLDEPSVGLDPLRVARLAELLRRRADGGVGLLVVTHDLDFACAVADRLLVLDAARHELHPLLDDWAGPLLAEQDATRAAARRAAVYTALVAALESPRGTAASAAQRGSPWAALGHFATRQLGALRVPGAVLFALPGVLRHQLRDVARVFVRTLSAALLRPAPFYLIVSAILGYTVLYVISRAMPEGLRVARAVELVGGSYILALTPPLCAFLFVATSGSALSAWLGTMDLTRQTTALEALGLRRESYLWVPAFCGLTLSFLAVAALFAGGMVLGGAYQAHDAGVTDPWPLLLGDLLAPAPDRWMLRTRAAWLLVLYAAGIASDVVYRGTLRKEESEDVTRAMTGSVVSSTLWVVGLELVTALWLWRR